MLITLAQNKCVFKLWNWPKFHNILSAAFAAYGFTSIVTKAISGGDVWVILSRLLGLRTPWFNEYFNMSRVPMRLLGTELWRFQCWLFICILRSFRLARRHDVTLYCAPLHLGPKRLFFLSPHDDHISNAHNFWSNRDIVFILVSLCLPKHTLCGCGITRRRISNRKTQGR